MTVNWHCYVLLLTLFLTSVCSIRNSLLKVSSEPVCSFPYSCLPTSECLDRHSVRGTEEVVFYCEGKDVVCCPPVKVTPSSVGPLHIDLNTYDTNKYNSVENRTRAPSQHQYGNKPNKKVNTCNTCNIEKKPVQNQPANVLRPHGVVGENAKRPPQGVLESRRPPQIPQQAPKGIPNVPQNLQKPKPKLNVHRNFRLLPTESNCGVNNFANRITEGEEVYLGEYPWMVLTGLKDKYGNYRWNCGGTLINGLYVLTAAHCLVVDNRTIEFVRLGEHSLTNDTDCNKDVCLDPPEDIKIAEVIAHEKWNTTTIKNDIALLRLSRNALQSGKSNIYPICLPVDMEKLNITSGTKYEIAGWGKTDWNADEGSDVLRKATISGVSREECNICKEKKKQQYCPIIDTQLCVQGWKSVDVCKGDSGGPLMVTRFNIYQIGITSFKGSEYCGAENIPSIFTKVESFMPWILDNLKE